MRTRLLRTLAKQQRRELKHQSVAVISASDQDIECKVLERLASGDSVKVSTLRTATAASLPVLAGMVRKKWIARDGAVSAHRDARRMERFGGSASEARLPTLTPNQQAIWRASGVSRSCRWPNCRQVALVDAADAGAARSGAD